MTLGSLKKNNNNLSQLGTGSVFVPLVASFTVMVDREEEWDAFKSHHSFHKEENDNDTQLILMMRTDVLAL